MSFVFALFSFLVLLMAPEVHSSTCSKDDDLKSLIPTLTKCLNPTQSSICKQREKYLEGRLNNSLSGDDFFKKIIEMDPKLVIIGEWHWNNSQNYLSNFLEKLNSSDSRINCLFLEFPSRFYKSLKKMNSGQNLPEEDAVLEDYKNLINMAQNKKMKIVFVDNHPDLNSMFLARSSQGMNNRDEVMSKEINSSLKSGDCNKGLMVVGKEHISDPVRADRKTLTDQFRLANTSVITVNLQSTLTTPREKADPSWLWPACSNLKISTKSIVFFENIAEPGDEYFLPEGGRWSDFSFTALLPN